MTTDEIKYAVKKLKIYNKKGFCDIKNDSYFKFKDFTLLISVSSNSKLLSRNDICITIDEIDRIIIHNNILIIKYHRCKIIKFKLLKCIKYSYITVPVINSMIVSKSFYNLFNKFLNE